MKKLFAVVVSLCEVLHAALFGFMQRTGMVLTAVSLPNGSIIAIASGYGAVKEMTAISNASEAVATLEASHGVVENDIIEVTSGWSRLNQKVVRADSVATNDVTLEDINTSSTTVYPTGSGTGSVREITGWTQLSQILSSSTSGGEQQFLEYQLLEADAKVRIPTFKNPSGFELEVADDPTLNGYILASTANDDRLQRAVKVTLPSGALIYFSAYVSLNKIPKLTVNEVMSCQVTLSLLNEPTRYTS